MKRIGITGPMGSGKSFICSIFNEEFCIPVFDSDAEAKACYAEPEVRTAVRQAFGPEVTMPDGSIHLKALSQKVFADTAQLEKINRIVHPAVMRRYRDWTGQQTGAPYTLFESAILYECGLANLFDAVIRISCPEALSIARVKARNGWDEETIRQRLRQQGGKNWAASDYTINHDSRLPLAESRLKLLPQIEEIHRQIIFMPFHNNPEQTAL
ncbi:MAG: dephospho-CoA kinase [Bacteroidales bacterium]|jgi:dephospho-CoA kinase|nr:dephospho-CoA kinase [Bacteroidales bacterium]